MDANDTLELERLASAARDALTDEMVSRLSATAAETIDLLDQVNRSGVARALPAVAQLVENGDLERLVALARTYGAAQDAMTDEMISRMAETVGTSLSLMDRLNRSGVDRLVGVLERLASSRAPERLGALADQLAAGLLLFERVVGAIDAANREMATEPAAAGGLAGMWRLMRDPQNQETLRFLLAVGRGLRAQSTNRERDDAPRS
jgi:uncharacterized protein YjgD (DUF1641 family)